MHRRHSSAGHSGHGPPHAHRSVESPADVAAAMGRAGFVASSGRTSVGILGHALGRKPSAAA